MLLKLPEPDDFIVSSGESYSIKQFVDETLKIAGFESCFWTGEGLNEVCKDNTGKILVKINNKLYRKVDIDNLVGDCSKLKSATEWQPQISFLQLVREMYEYDYAREQSLLLLPQIRISQAANTNECKEKLRCYKEPVKTETQNWKYTVSKPFITKESASRVISALQNTEISSKCNWVQQFEINLREVFKVNSSVACSNGYSALVIALKAARIEQNSIVLIPSGTMVAVANAVIDVNCIPIVVDNCNKFAMNPSAQKFAKVYSDYPHPLNIKAVIITHTYGIPADVDEIIAFCKQKGLILIEDIAEAVGTTYKGQLVGTFGDFATASLYANKLLTSGDGGFVISKHKKFKGENVQQQFQTLINHGFTDQYHFLHKEQTGNYRISGLAGAFASPLPKMLELFVQKRKIIDAWYRTHLRELEEFITLMPENSFGDSTPWVFSLIINECVKASAQDLRQHLCNSLIETRSFFYPIDSQPFYQKYSLMGPNDFPNCAYQYKKGLYLPTYHSLKECDVIFICKAVRSFFDVSPPTAKMS